MLKNIQMFTCKTIGYIEHPFQPKIRVIHRRPPYMGISRWITVNLPCAISRSLKDHELNIFWITSHETQDSEIQKYFSTRFKIFLSKCSELKALQILTVSSKSKIFFRITRVAVLWKQSLKNIASFPFNRFFIMESHSRGKLNIEFDRASSALSNGI